MDFQIIVEALCQSFFECQNQFSRAPLTLRSNAEGFLSLCLTNCVGAFCETGSVTHKKVLVVQSFVPKKSLHEIS
jgi:hypothetical protein